MDVEPNPVVRLAQAGHRILDADLTLMYGLSVVGGVAAELRGRGVWGTVAFERHLSRPVRLSVAWAEGALDDFATATDWVLLEDGWQQIGPGCWQLIAIQPDG